MTPSAAGRVILVDDQKSLVWGNEKFLKEKGFDVDAAYDGIEGEEKILKGDYDIVVIDLRLPGRNGLEVLERTASKTSARFIMMSAFATAEDAEKAALLGARDFLSKPFLPEELHERIEEILAEDLEKRERGKARWITLRFPPLRVDVFYGEKNPVYIDKAGAKGSEHLILACDISDYEKGYLSALLDSGKDIFSLKEKAPGADKVVFFMDLSGCLVCMTDAGARRIKDGCTAECEKKPFVLQESESVLLSHCEPEKALNELFLKPGSGAMALRDSICRGERKWAVLISRNELSDLSRREEEFIRGPSFREDVLHFLSSLPPSQRLSEVQRNKIDLLLCEMVTNLEEARSSGPVKVCAEAEKEKMTSISFLFNGGALLPPLTALPGAQRDIEALSGLQRGQLFTVLMTNIFKEGEMEVVPGRDRVLLRL